MKRIVVVGGSLAGVNALEEIRARGFEGDLVLVGSEPHLPYTRPPLSKEALANGIDHEQLRDAAMLSSLVTSLGAGERGRRCRAWCVHLPGGCGAHVPASSPIESGRHPECAIPPGTAPGMGTSLRCAAPATVLHRRKCPTASDRAASGDRRKWLEQRAAPPAGIDDLCRTANRPNQAEDYLRTRTRCRAIVKGKDGSPRCLTVTMPET